MKRSLTIASHSKICLALVLLLLFPSAYAQTEQSSTAPDSIEVVIKDTETQQTDTFVIDTAGIIAITDGIMAQQRKRRELSKFRPDHVAWAGHPRSRTNLQP